VKNMKRIIMLLVSLVLLSSIVFAAQQGIHDPGTGNENPDIQTAGQGTGQGLDQESGLNTSQSGQRLGQGQQINAETQNQGESQQLQAKEQVRSQISELRQEMEQKRQQLNTGAAESNEKKQQMMQNQNQVKVAAQTLSKMESMIGSRGKEISEIAKEFNNSVQATIKAEEKIQTRSGFAKFFAGGDKKAAEELENEATKNQQRIQELKQLKDEAECDEEVKQMMQEQIQQMEQEQTRLSELAQKEKKSKGMFGWIWK
jgi:hypothetical protein